MLPRTRCSVLRIFWSVNSKHSTTRRDMMAVGAIEAFDQICNSNCRSR